MVESLVEKRLFQSIYIEAGAPRHFTFDRLRQRGRAQRRMGRVSLHLLNTQETTRKHDSGNTLRCRWRESIVPLTQIDSRNRETDRGVPQPPNHTAPLFRILMFKRAREAVERAFNTVRPADNAPLDKQRRSPPGRYDRHQRSESAQRIRAGVETCDVAFCGCVGIEFHKLGRPSGHAYRETRSLSARLHEDHHKWQCAGCFKNVCGN